MEPPTLFLMRCGAPSNACTRNAADTGSGANTRKVPGLRAKMIEQEERQVPRLPGIHSFWAKFPPTFLYVVTRIALMEQH
jgi:hypothetical protein